ncbi:MAG: RIP metalloprotease RseP [Bacillota bacterium]
MQTFWAAVFVFGLLIIFHELGHFILARAVGIQIHEFSIGFGPRLFSIPRGETAYNLRLFPLGGFVRMAGMDPEEKITDEARSFNKKPVWQRMLVIGAGSVMNFVLAILILALIFMIQGVPALTPEGLPKVTTVVEQLVPGGPAEKAGLLPKDKIVAIDGREITSWEQMTEIIGARPDQNLTLTVRRAGEVKEILVTPRRDEQGKGKIGVYPAPELRRLSLFSALAAGTEYTVRVTAVIINFIGQMISGRAPADLGGPVRIVWEINRAAEFGMFNLLQLAAFLSINLGLFNLFPVPALDGSRLMFLTVEWVRGRPVDPVKENFIHMIGFGLLILLIVVITYNDLLQLLQR